MKLNYFIIILFAFSNLLAKASQGNYSKKDIYSNPLNKTKISGVYGRCLQNIDEGVKWSARDSVVRSNDKQMISLYGNAKLECSQFVIIADEIIYNKEKKELSAKNYTINYKESNKKEIGKFGVFSIIPAKKQ